MDFRNVKSLAIPEGSVKELRIGGVSVWRKPSAVSYGVTITTDNAAPITDFYVLRDASKTFEAEFNVPASEQNITPAWSITGLPSGLSASGATVSGYASSAGTSTVTVTVTKGSYSDSKRYTFAVTSDGYGLDITSLSFNHLPPEYWPNGPEYFFRGITYTAQYNVTENLPSSVGTLRYYIEEYKDEFSSNSLTLNSSTGGLTIIPPSGYNYGEHLYVFAERYPYRSIPYPFHFTHSVKNPVPNFEKLLGLDLSTVDEDYDSNYKYDLNFSISAANARSSSYVGSVYALESYLITGDNFGSLFGRTVQVDGQALPCTINGTTSGNPKFTVKVKEDDYDYQNGSFYLLFYLESRYTGTAATLKKLSSTHTITVSNDYGTVSKNFTLSYV